MTSKWSNCRNEKIFFLHCIGDHLGSEVHKFTCGGSPALNTYIFYVYEKLNESINLTTKEKLESKVGLLIYIALGWKYLANLHYQKKQKLSEFSGYF